MSNQPNYLCLEFVALYLAEFIENDPSSKPHHDAAAACLRRQHAEIEALNAERDALKTENDRLSRIVAAANWHRAQEEHNALRAECDALRAELASIGAQSIIFGYWAQNRARHAAKETEK